ncbi:MAG: adenylate/guanylate cyclase domain-containing protein [Bradyrhizobium sp.]
MSTPLAGPRVTLFVTVLSLFLIVALLVGTVVTITNYIEARKTALKVAEDAFRATINQINERRLAFFAPAFLLTEVLQTAPSLQQESASRDPFLQLVLSSLKSNPQISAIYAGHQNGNYFQVLSISEHEKPFIARLGGPSSTRYAIQDIRSDGSAGRKETWRFLDSNYGLIGALPPQDAGYDPRRRDWYRTALERPGATIRLPPYLFATTSQVGMTLAKAFDGNAGAVGIDITLERLMVYVGSVRANDAHRFVAFDEKNRLLAHFDPNQMFKHTGPPANAAIELATTADISDPVVRDALRVFAQAGPFRIAEVSVDGTAYLATVDRQIARDGGVFFVLYAAPLSDFQGTLMDAARRSIPIALLVLMALVPVIVYLARSISRPLARLSGEAELIQSFHLDDPIRMNSRVVEINTLIKSMSGMKSTIREVSKFVPKALVKDILESEEIVAVGGKTRRISILFTDVRDFTPIAENIPPTDLMESMSEYFEELASLIINKEGTVDKFIGDAIFSFWNAPLAVTNHEHLACATALECHAASRRLNVQWIDRGLPAWYTRFGIHVGEAVLGNVGSSDRIDYTAIGDNVNIAARLEGLNKYYGSSILASGQIASVCSKEFLFRRVDRTQPKGLGRSLDIFELLGPLNGNDESRVSPAMIELVRSWDSVYEVYASRDWMGTFQALETFADDYPDDVLAGIYLDRVVGFMLDPPSEAWDGVIHFGQK